jgi:hypothetical protein
LSDETFIKIGMAVKPDFNIRMGYRVSYFEIWVNALNIFNECYSTISQVSVSGGTAAYTYQLGDLGTFTLGLFYRFRK